MSLSEWIAQEEKGQDKLATDASISLYFFCRFQWYSYHARAPEFEVERDKNCLVLLCSSFFFLHLTDVELSLLSLVLKASGLAWLCFGHGIHWAAANSTKSMTQVDKALTLRFGVELRHIIRDH